MFEFIVLFFDICLLKKAPQDLPYSLSLLKILLVINILINFLLSNMSSDWLNSLLQILANVVLITGFCWICLFFAKKTGRFCQTASALVGTDTLISLFSLPAAASSSINQMALLTFLISIILFIWYWLVTGHIMRNALEQSFSFSLGLAFLYLLTSIQISSLIIT